MGPSLGKHKISSLRAKLSAFQVRGGKNGGDNFNLLKNMRIKDIPKIERPREKLLKFGPESLSDKELLAILIGHGLKGKSAIEMAEDLLNEYKTLRGLAGRRLDEFMKIKGIKEAKIVKIAVAFEIAKRIYLI